MAYIKPNKKKFKFEKYPTKRSAMFVFTTTAVASLKYDGQTLCGK